MWAMLLTICIFLKSRFLATCIWQFRNDVPEVREEKVMESMLAIFVSSWAGRCAAQAAPKKGWCHVSTQGRGWQKHWVHGRPMRWEDLAGSKRHWLRILMPLKPCPTIFFFLYQSAFNNDLSHLYYLKNLSGRSLWPLCREWTLRTCSQNRSKG